MEVLCERCQTEYDFDDALVSERGTTVKCTSCGHQFRIFRPAVGAPERWTVRTRAGSEYVFTSLRDLQRAITRAQVDRADTLVRDGMPPRTLASIAELEPFFPRMPSTPPQRMVEPPEPRARRITPRGLGDLPPPRPQPLNQTEVLPQPELAPLSDPGPVKPAIGVSSVAATLNTNKAQRQAANTTPRQASDMLGEEPPFEPETVRLPATVEQPRPLPPVAPVPQKTAKSRADEDVVIRERDQVLTPTPSDVRASFQSFDELHTDPRYEHVPVRRSAAVRWVVALVVIGGLAVVGITVGPRLFKASSQHSSLTTASDARVMELLREGDQRLADGDMVGAKESFDKASALAERDVRVLVQLARWGNVTADQAWLKARLVSDPDAAAIAKRDLDEKAKRASTTANLAAQISADDPAVLRVRVDALRLSGDIAGARSLAPRLTAQAAEPEAAYVLAALDLSEANPNWAGVIDRLKAAVAGEQNLGRARAALAYAYAASGQVEAANAEIDTLAKSARPHPLLVELRAFASKARKPGDAGSDGAVDPSSLPVAVVGGGQPTDPNSPAPVGPYQDTLRRAHEARAAGDLNRAEQLYQSVLAQNPSDAEALGGLGDIARARGDKNASLRYYEQVQKNNPGYLPALVGMADAKWDAGDKAGAAAIYRQILDKVGGQGPYADHARQRIAAAGAAPTSTATSTGTTKSSASPPPPPTTTSSGSNSPPPGVDTSDLPGWKP